VSDFDREELVRESSDDRSALLVSGGIDYFDLIKLYSELFSELLLFYKPAFYFELLDCFYISDRLLAELPVRLPYYVC